MPKPRALGYVAAGIVRASRNRLAQNKQAAIDLVQHNYHGDRDAVTAMVKLIVENETIVAEVLLLLEAGQLHEAEDLLLGAGPQK